MSFEPPHPRDVNREEIRRALRSSFPENDPQQLEEYGDGLTAIAEAQDIPMEALIFWIHDKPAGKDFSQHGWRVWCARYSTARDLLPPEAAVIQPATPEPLQLGMESERPHALCTHCYAQVLWQINGLWWCPRCGVVQL